MSTKSVRGSRVVHFGEFEVDMRSGELRRGEEKVLLQEQPYRILTMLLERPGEVVLRDEICKRLWPNGTVVEVSHGINAAVLRLREALGDSAANPHFIETVARRGYRLLAPAQVECRTVPATGQDLAPGRKVSHFRLEEMLGRGGMGVVYRAEDVHLNRPVALKFLAPETADDPVAVGRFQREARTASSLNHPNICTVYAVQEIGGQPVIVMELLEGRTLESLLAAGPLPVDQALAYAIQTAAALDAAQRKGIVHRDLKPGNIMVTQFGVKVLDFGLAKQSVTGAAATQTASLAGTPNYMAPELFQGKPADARSDIYSLGLILSEMLSSSPELRPVIRRALEADPENRWQTAGDLRAALECVSVAPAKLSLSQWMRRSPGIPAVASLAAVLVCWFALARPVRTADPSPITVRPISANREIPKRVQVSGRINLSPDGELLAYSDGGGIYVRPVAGGDSRLVASQQGMAGTPFWSPDGRALAFTNGGHLYTVPAAGGVATKIGDVDTAFAGVWGPGGAILIGKLHQGLVSIPANGGPSRTITEPDPNRGEVRHLLPQFLPGGRSYLFTAGSDKPGESALYAGSLGSSKRVRIGPIGSGAIFVPRTGSAGYLVFYRDTYLMAQRFDAKTLRTEGDAVRIAGPVNAARAAGAIDVAIPDASVTRTTLAYRPTAGGDIILRKDWMSTLP